MAIVVDTARRGTVPVSDAGRLFWPDLVRVYAIAAVVLLHSEAVPNSRFGEIPMGVWWQTNVYHAFVCTCIPLFLMLSGALLLPRERLEPIGFMRRRLVKVLLPLPAWTLIYAAWRKYAWGHDIGAGDVLISFVEGMHDPIFPHLWFVYLIVSLYLLVPVVHVYFHHSSQQAQLYFAALWIVASALKPTIEKYLGIQVGYYLDPFFGGIGYFLLGAMIVRYLPDRLPRVWLGVCAAVIAAGYGATLFATYAFSLAAGKLDDHWYQLLSPTVMLMSIPSFLLLRHAGSVLAQRRERHPRLTGAIATLSTLTFGIYLVHALVIVLLESGRLGFTMNPTMLPPIVAAPLMAAVVFFASAAAAGLIRRLPGLRWLAP